MLLRQPLIRKIIYVSCKPDHYGPMINFKQLLIGGVKKKYKKFRLASVRAVDMFPHTMHYEMILVFERDVSVLFCYMLNFFFYVIFGNVWGCDNTA